MTSDKFKGFIQLTRPVNCLITMASIMAACIISGGTKDNWPGILIASLVGALIAAGANAMNDSFDVEIDRINRPDRPIPRGAVTAHEARTFSLSISSAGVLLNVLLNPAALGIALTAGVSLYFYNSHLKKSVLAGNILVAAMTGLAFVYGAVVIGRPERSVVPALFAFLVNLARELVKDVEDVEGDSRNQAVTLPVKYGQKTGIFLASVVMTALIIATLVVSMMKVYSVAYLYFVLIVDAFLIGGIVLMWKDPSRASMARVSNLLKINMAVGLAAIYLGSLP